MRARLGPLVTALGALLPGAAAPADPTPGSFTIAFIGDQGLGPHPVDVLNLIAEEGADAVMHSGDFDYEGNPAAWEAQIDSVLGPNFPYFATIGNHDTDKFYVAGGYQDRMEARMQRLGIAWQGDLGVRGSFEYQGIFFVTTAPGIFELGDPQHVYENYLTASLATNQSIWRIASFHKDMRNMQVGGKEDETGWGVYEAARRGGAIIATAHEHSYERTHLLSNCQNQTVANTDSMLVLARDNPATPADEGRSFVFVSGIGGKSIRDQERCLPMTPPYGCQGEWASIYTSDQGANEGALFGVFNLGGGDPTLAFFYFKDTTGFVPDMFYVRAAVPACPCDLNGDGIVGVPDFLGLLRAWGTAGPIGDVNGSSLVNVADMLLLLLNWGPCT